MGVIFKREFKSHLTNIFGWIFIAVSIAIIGIFVVLVNFIGTVPQMEYGFKSSLLAMLLTVPFLCMFVFPAENKSGNIKFLLSLPIKAHSIVLGKYLAALAIFAIPTAIMATIPLLLSTFGNVLLSQSYSSIFAYFLIGADMIAMCMFIGAHFRRSILSLILGILVSAILFAGPTLASYIPTSPIVSFIAILVIEAVIALIVWLTSKRLTLTAISFAVFAIPTAAAYLISASSFAALFERIICFVSPFERMVKFTQGIFDVRDVIYLLSVAALFLFFTYRAVEKTRGEELTLKNKKALITVAASLAVVIALNLGIFAIPANLTSFDASGLDMYSISDATKNFLSKTDEDVTIYFLCEKGMPDAQIEQILQEYDAASPHIDYKLINVSADPEFILEYTGFSYDHVDESGGYPLNNYSIIIESGKRCKIIDSSSYYSYKIGSYVYNESEFLYYCEQAAADGYNISAIGYSTYFDLDRVIASGIEYVTLDKVSTVFTLTGHGEKALADKFYKNLKYSGVVYDELLLEEHSSVPENCSAIIISSPTTDISSDDADKIIEYLNRGGDVILVTSPENTRMQNLLRVTQTLGLTAENGIIRDEEEKYHTGENSADLIPSPKLEHNVISFIASNYDTSSISLNPRFPNAHPIIKIENKDESLSAMEMFSTSEKAVVANGDDISDIAKMRFTGYSAQKSLDEYKSKVANLFWFSSYEAFSDEYALSNPINTLYLLASLSYAGGTPEFESSLSIDSRNISGSFLEIPQYVPVVWIIAFSAVSLVILCSGILILISRKNRKDVG